MNNSNNLPRRNFVRNMSASALTLACAPSLLLHQKASASPASAVAAQPTGLASAFMDAGSNPPSYRLNVAGRQSAPLPGRGHGIAVSGDRSTIVSFARRPERWMQIYRMNGAGEYVLSQQLSTPDDRHGMGHGVFSADGARLYTTENDVVRGRGVIGIYDTASFSRIGELDSGGVGPHEIVLLPSSGSASAKGDLVCVANGGLETDPDYPRMVLNEGEIDSSLAFLEINAKARISSRVLGVHRLPSSASSLSIRHLAAVDSATVCFGCQDQDELGSSEFSDLLVGLATIRPGPDAAVRMLSAIPQASGYIGSVAYERASNTLLTSAPRGNCVALWSLDSPTSAPVVHAIKDACGACAPASQPGQFLVSTGFGELWLLPANGSAAELVASTGSRHYDNHMIMV